jgi:anaerobic selenocysteine-containing dehydrogenase
MEEFITACPRNCYSTCSFKVQVENNKIRRILPFSLNKATPEGPCIKGLSYIERAHSDQRIIHPLLKTGNGTFRQITADEAFDRIAGRLSDIRECSGPHSIMWYKGSGNSGLTNDIGNEFWKAFGGASTTYGNLCWPAGLEAVRLTLGSVKHNVPWDLKQAKTIIIWGKNPAETNIQEMAFIAAGKENGSKVIVVDLRRTPTADKADLLICPKPGTDGALALSIAWILVNEQLTDQEFISSNVLGYDEFIRNLNITPDIAESITGIPSNMIYELAYLIGKNKPVTFLPGYGLQRHLNGGQTIRSILALAVITGNLGRSGAGFNYANLQGYVFDTLKEPLSYYPDAESDKPFRRTISMVKLGTDMMNLTDPPLKAAWVERGNPLTQSPDSLNVKKAFSQLEFRVVVEQFMNDTASLADIILPAKDIFEQSDIISSYWSPYIQFKPGILKPEDDIMPENEIYYHLAKRLDLNVDNSLIPEPGGNNIEAWLDRRIRGYTQLSLEDIRNGPVIAPGLQEIAYEDLKFDTPSGKIELFSASANSKWGISSLPEYIPLNHSDRSGIFPLVFITPNSGSRIHSQFGNLRIIKETTVMPSLEISPADASTRNILTGDKVRIFNGRGEVITFASITNRLPIGLVVMPNGLWLNEGGTGNILVNSDETDIGFGTAFHDTFVEIEKVG